MNIDFSGILLGYTSRSGTTVTYHRLSMFSLIKSALERLKSKQTYDFISGGAAINAMIMAGASEISSGTTDAIFVYKPAIIDYGSQKKTRAAIQILNQSNDWASGNTYVNFDKLAEDVAYLDDYANTRTCDVNGDSDVPDDDKVLTIQTVSQSWSFDTGKWSIYSPGDSSTGFTAAIDSTGTLDGATNQRVVPCYMQKGMSIDLNGNYAKGIIDYFNERIPEISDEIVARVSTQFVQR